MGEETTANRIQGAMGVLDDAQARQLASLATTLTPQQALWLSGYLAGLAGQAANAAGGNGGPHGGAGDGGGEGAPVVTVLYGTETGNAEGVAQDLVEKATADGLPARAVDMADYRTKDLRNEQRVVLISSTHGEGDPPEPAAGFFEFLWSRKAPSLEGTKFAVLSLGDSSYAHFCKAGQDLDERFEELGGERLADRADLDVDYDDEAEEWAGRVVNLLKEAVPAGAPSGSGSGVPGGAPVGRGAGAGLLGSLFPGVGGELNGGGNGVAAPAPTRPKHSRKNPYRAEILENIRLNGRESDKETHHIELLVEEGALPFQPGDSLGILPANEPALVDEVLETLQLSPGERVSVGDEERTLSEALERDLELTRLTPGFLRSYAQVADARELAEILGDDDRERLERYMASNQVVDVLQQFPVTGLGAQEFVEMLRRLQPRLYSIASSQEWLPDQIDLTVALTRTTADGKERNGVASTYLGERVQPGDTVDVYVQPNKAFRLPEDPDAPILMIGAGTGVAPYRAFLQEREETGAEGPTWLFFGERRFREDFLYQTEWQRFLDDGVLNRMDVAFSRDGPEKVYVQDRLRTRSAEVYEWLQEGAHLYVCGDADGMAPGVHRALLDIIQEEGDRSEEEAEAYLKGLRDEKRYQRDVY